MCDTGWVRCKVLNCIRGPKGTVTCEVEYQVGKPLTDYVSGGTPEISKLVLIFSQELVVLQHSKPCWFLRRRCLFCVLSASVRIRKNEPNITGEIDETSFSVPVYGLKIDKFVPPTPVPKQLQSPVRYFNCSKCGGRPIHLFLLTLRIYSADTRDLHRVYTLRVVWGVSRRSVTSHL